MGHAGVAVQPHLGEQREIPLSASNTIVAFTVRWLGAITVYGRFTELAGTVRIPPAGVESASVEVDVMTASLRTGIRLRDRHVRGRSFLDAARFPVITFRAERPLWHGPHLHLLGALTIRGLARPVELSCSFDGPVNGTMPSLRATGVTTIRRSDFAVGSPLGRLSRDPRFRVIGDEVWVTASVRARVPDAP